MKIGTTKARGIAPIIPADELAPDQAQIALNCKLRAGHIKPWYNFSEEATPVNTGTIRTIFLYEDSHWLEWEADVDVVLAPVAGDTQGRFYYTGDGIPKKSNRTEATTGGGAKPVNFYPLAVPTPVHALTATPGSGGSGDDRVVNYVWTVVTSWSEEGAPSPASSNVTCRPGQTVSLSGMTLEWQASTEYDEGNFVFKVGDEGGTYVYKCVQAGTSGSSEPTWGTTVDEDTNDGTVVWRCYKNNLSTKRIYRLEVGEQYASYQYLDSISISSTTYTDTTLPEELGAELGTEDYDPPLDELMGLTYMGSGVIAAFTGKDLYFCEPYAPWAWPTDYNITVPEAIVGLAASAGVLYVLTEGRPYVITGTDPRSFVPVELPGVYPLVSKRAKFAHKGGVYYATIGGIANATAGNITLITEAQMDSEKWSEYHPTTMHASLYNNYLFFFYNYGDEEGAVIYDLITNEMMTMNYYCDAAYYDGDNDKLYMVMQDDSDDNKIYLWEGDDTQPLPSSFKWRSKRFILPARTVLSTARVIAEQGDRTDYYESLKNYQSTVERNNALISSWLTSGAISENEIGYGLEINGDELVDPGSEPTYSGDFTLVFRVYYDDALRLEKEVYSDYPFRVISGRRPRAVYYEVESNLEIKRVDLASTTEEIKT